MCSLRHSSLTRESTRKVGSDSTREEGEVIHCSEERGRVGGGVLRDPRPELSKIRELEKMCKYILRTVNGMEQQTQEEVFWLYLAVSYVLILVVRV